MQIKSTKYFRERTEKIQYIILHCSAGSPQWMADVFNQCEVSTHYIIGQDGDITEICSPDKVAYHAGESSWGGSTEYSLNGCSIGIELETQKLGQVPTDYTSIQIQVLIDFLKKLSEKYHIQPKNILGHSDIAPLRKPDPGICFPWSKLAEENLSLWYDENLLASETDEKTLLENIGYCTADLNAARYAFCRHYYPKDITVVDDLKVLANHPFEENFMPKDFEKYQKILRAVAYAFQQHL